MTPEFWKERWQTNEIGFHEGQVNALLARHWPSIGLPAGSRIFVPLCGKSNDMAWLAGQGYAVLGVELSEIAVRDFFAENGLKPQTESRDGYAISRAGPIEIWCGDFFALKPAHLSDIAGVYDRASLIALPPDLRRAYAQKMLGIIPAKAPTLLITFDYDQREMHGPPFAVSMAEVAELFGAHSIITEIERREALSTSPRFKERGLTHAESFAVRLDRK